MTTRLLSSVLLCCCLSLAAQAQGSWEWTSPTPSGVPPTDLAYGDGTFLLSNGYATLRSEDGVHWSTLDVASQEVLFDSHTFYALTATGITEIAPDGTIGTTHPLTDSVYDLVASQGHFVGLIDTSIPTNEIRTSTDLTTWTRQGLPEGFTTNKILAHEGVFVLVGWDGSILRSTDLTNWTQIPIDTSLTIDGNGWGAHNGYQFLVRWARGDGFYSSTDGLTWTKTTEGPAVGSDLNRVSLGAADGHFYFDSGPSGGGTFVSNDGVNWIPRADAFPSRSADEVIPVDFNHLVGGNGFVVGLSPTQLRYYANNNYAHLWGSLDYGASWIDLSATSRDYTTGPLLFSHGRFYLGGQVSLDGITWSNSTPTLSAAAGDLLFRFDANVSSDFPVYLSRDGIHTEIIDPLIQYPNAVAYGNGRYVMVSNGGSASTSTDGVTWTTAGTIHAGSLRTVTYAFDRFFAAGTGNVIYTSTDGLNWTANPIPDLDGGVITALVASDDRLLVRSPLSRGQDTPHLTGTTVDGIPLVFPTTHIIYDAVWETDRFVAIAAAYPISWSAGADWTVPAGEIVVAESTDGETWSPIFHIANVEQVLAASAFLVRTDDQILAHVRPGRLQTGQTGIAMVLRKPLTTAAPIQITYPPLATSIARGETGYLAFGASGSGPFTYQWLKDGVEIADATDPSYEIAAAVDSNQGSYAVRITNSEGTVESAAVALTITDPTPLAITRQPASGTVDAVRDWQLNVDVTGSGPVTYQWRKDGVDIPDANRRYYWVRDYSRPYTEVEGTYDVVVTAPYSTITSAPAVITWDGPRAQLDFADHVLVPPGASMTLSASVEGDGPYTYRWIRLSSSSQTQSDSAILTLDNITSQQAGYWRLTVNDSNGNRTELQFYVEVGANSGVPFVIQPATKAVVLGETTTLSVEMNEAWSSAPLQWYRDGIAIDGATSSTLTLTDITEADIARYSASLIWDGTTYFTTATTVRLNDARLVNLSARGWSSSGDGIFTVGFVTSGDPAVDDGPILVRGVGPGLADFGVGNTLADPKIALIDQASTTLAANDNWYGTTTGSMGTSAGLQTFARYGAFALSDSGHDAAMALAQPAPAPYTVPVTDVTAGEGVVLTEIYVDPAGQQRLTNLSVRAPSAPGERMLTAGFAITGTEPLRLMIRAVGPGLVPFGVTGVMGNPRIVLYDQSGDEVGNNDTWQDGEFAADMREFETRTGAFALVEGSNDAVLIMELEPGIYTAQAQGVDEEAGIVLLELYELL